MDKFPENFMIVGAGFGQIPAIRAARRLGLRTIAVDRCAEAEGMSLVDRALPIDIVDIDSVVAAARFHAVSGVMTMQSDIGVVTVGCIVDSMGLPGNGRTVSERCCNKIQTRRRLTESGVTQPCYRVIKSPEDALGAAKEMGFPCIVKAPDSSGSRGVVKVHSASEIYNACAEASKFARCDELLIEGFIDGLEIGAQAFSIDHHCVSVWVHDDAVSPPPHIIPIGHSFPSSLPISILSEVETSVRMCIDALGIASGPSNIDIIIGRDERPYIIEVGARIGATCLPELIQYHTDIDWVGAAVLAALGDTPALTSSAQKCCAAYIIEAPCDGVLKSYEIPDDLLRHPDILEFEITAKPGDIVSRLRNGTDRVGKIVTKGRTREAADRIAREVRSAVRFEIEPV